MASRALVVAAALPVAAVAVVVALAAATVEASAVAVVAALAVAQLAMPMVPTMASTWSLTNLPLAPRVLAICMDELVATVKSKTANKETKKGH